VKKSQVVDEIVSVIKDTILLSEKDMATAILHKLEKLGMKAPNRFKCDCNICRDCSWEDENA